MPYSSASATKSITVKSVTVSLSVSPSAPWKAGQTIRLSGLVTINGSAGEGRTVEIYLYSQLGFARLGSVTTGIDGSYSFTWTIPWTVTITPAGTVTVPCKSWSFYAKDVGSGVQSPYVSGSVAYPTRITISAPDTAVPAQPVTVSGVLQYESSSGTWSGLGGRTVTLYIDSTKIADVTTGSDGSYSYTFSAPGPGTYTLKAVYAGEGTMAAAYTSLKIYPFEITKLTAPVTAIAIGTAAVMLSMWGIERASR